MRCTMYAVSLCLMAVSVLFAAELKLRNGTVYKGEIVSDAGDFFALKVGTNRLAINKSLVATIDGKPYKPVQKVTEAAKTEDPRPANANQSSQNVKPVAPEPATPAATGHKSGSGKPWKVTLVNGTVFSGKLISENVRILVIESKGSPVSIYRNMITAIDSGTNTTTLPESQVKKDKPLPPTNIAAAGALGAASTVEGSAVVLIPAKTTGTPIPDGAASAGNTLPAQRIKVATLTDDGGAALPKKDAVKPPAALVPPAAVAQSATPITMLPQPRSRVSVVQFQGSETDETTTVSSEVSRASVSRTHSDTPSTLQVIRAPLPAFVAQRRQEAAPLKTVTGETAHSEAVAVPGNQNAPTVSSSVKNVPVAKNRPSSVAAPQGKQVEVVPVLSIITPPPLPQPVQPVLTTAPLLPTASTGSSAPLPALQLPQEKARAKRTDGKQELILTNGTVFVGTIKSEGARSIGFNADGAVITILKKLIKEIDGKPYAAHRDTASRSTDDKPAISPNASTRESSGRSCKTNISLFRAVPFTELPKGLTTDAIIDSMTFRGDWKVRSRAARMLAAMGPWGVSAIPVAVEMLDDEESKGYAVPLMLDSAQALELLPPSFEAARALGQLGTQGGTELLKAIRSSKKSVRMSAFFGLGNCFFDAANKAVLTAQQDPEPEVRHVALGSLRMSTAALPLAEACKDADPSVRTAAVILLGKLEPAVALKHLSGMVRDHNAHVRRILAETIGTIGCPGGSAALLQLSKDTDVFVKATAVHSLGMVKDSTVLDAIMATATDPAADVRGSAAQALGYLRNSRSIPILYALMKDDNQNVREKAAISLKLHTEVPQLIAALDDVSAAVRANASYMLWLLTGQEFGDNKKAWETWAAALEKPSPPAKK